MGYPATVDTGQIVPSALYQGELFTGGSGSAVTAGSAYFYDVIVNATVTIIQMRTALSGAPTGNIDMGVYDSTGTNGQPNNLLGNTGAQLSATGVFTKSLSANLTLPPGKYWLAIIDTVADSIFQRSSGNAGIGVAYKSTATNLIQLANPAGAIATNATKIYLEALLLGGFS